MEMATAEAEASVEVAVAEAAHQQQQCDYFVPAAGTTLWAMRTRAAHSCSRGGEQR